LSTAFRDFYRSAVHFTSIIVEKNMSNAWIALGICVVFVLGAALPLIRKRDQTPLPPPKETLRDWRNEK